MKYLIQALEWFFWQTRIIIIIGVIAGILASLSLVVIGTADAYDFISGFVKAFGGKKGVAGMGAIAFMKAIKLLEIFLAAALILLFSFGIFQVFIRRISRYETNPEAAQGLIIGNMEQFRDKFLKLLHIMLVLEFFKFALSIKYSGEKDLLYLGGAIFLVAASMYLAQKK